MAIIGSRQLSVFDRLLLFFGWKEIAVEEVELAPPEEKLPVLRPVKSLLTPPSPWIILGTGKLTKTIDERTYFVTIKSAATNLSDVGVKAKTLTGEMVALRDEEIDKIRQSVVVELKERGLLKWLPAEACTAVEEAKILPVSVELGREQWVIDIGEDESVVYSKVLEKGDEVRIETAGGWVTQVMYKPKFGTWVNLTDSKPEERKLFLQLRNRIRVRPELVAMRAMVKDV